MNKVKINPGLASIVLLASLFSGWQTLLIVTAIIFAFCEVDEKVKKVAISVITFYVGYYIISLGWDLIVDGYGVLTKCINHVVGIINSYLDYDKQLSIAKLEQYLLNPAKHILDSLDLIVGFLLTFAKLFFVINTLTNKPGKENVITKKINEFTNKALNFINNIEFGQPMMNQQPMQQPVQQQPMQYNNPNNGM